MKRASPVEMRKVLEIVEMYVKAGIPFMPMPVMGDEDNNQLVALAQARLEILLRRAEEAEAAEKGGV